MQSYSHSTISCNEVEKRKQLYDRQASIKKEENKEKRYKRKNVTERRTESEFIDMLQLEKQ
ncbi:MAG: hypothetical protein BGO68_03770 [Candidatus Amoebophilus sp. 36-38]|nr:MAG: hypothetical protein BGO68_03770 [Candidatus Amoebophilus sp. 36-38]